MSVDSRLNLFSATLEDFKEPAVHRHARHSREGHAFDIEVSAQILGLRASEGENREMAIPGRKEGLSLVLVEDLHQAKVACREEFLQLFAGCPCLDLGGAARWRSHYKWNVGEVTESRHQR
jgi:hypothetical protein